LNALISENEEILCSNVVKFYAQPAGIIVANREKTANIAAKLVKINYSQINNNKPILTVEDVLKSSEKSKRLTNNITIQPTDVGNDVKSILYGEYKVEAQYHFYMEPQTCIVKPAEDGLDVYAATQWIDLSQVAIAQSLKMPVNRYLYFLYIVFIFQMLPGLFLFSVRMSVYHVILEI
jgi:xanthine dehydrogenase/oxidase